MRVVVVVVVVLMLVVRSAGAFAVSVRCVGGWGLACEATDEGDAARAARRRAERAVEAETDAHLMGDTPTELNIGDTLAKMMVGENEYHDDSDGDSGSIRNEVNSRNARVDKFKAIYAKIKTVSSGEGASFTDVDGKTGPVPDAAALLEALFPEQTVRQLSLTPCLAHTDTLTLTQPSRTQPTRYLRRSTSGK